MNLIVPSGAKRDRAKAACPLLTSMMIGANELGQPEAAPIYVECPESEKKCRLWVSPPGECALVLTAKRSVIDG